MIEKFRDPIHDDWKSITERKQIFEEKRLCTLEDCQNLLTEFKGPGQEVLCREHQVEQREYGGFGRIDRPHTFHRGFVCDECGQDARELPVIKAIQDEVIKMRAIRSIMHADHKQLKSEGGSDAEKNIRLLCITCHNVKTQVEQDYLGGKRQHE
jgi:5-methylcytosine-specific restriction endonuclease McrA